MAVSQTMDCEAVEKLLGAWCDGELRGDEADLVPKHVEGCPSCRLQRAQLERLDNSIREAFQEKAAEVRFDVFWAGIEGRLAEKRSWRAWFTDWAAPAFEPRRVGWAVSLAAVLIIGLLSFSDVYRRWFFAPNGGRVRIESIDAHGLDVAVFREAQTRMTIIWLFPAQESDDEPQEESSSENLLL